MRSHLIYEAQHYNFIVPEERWVCELALWARNVIKHGKFVAGAGGCEAMLIHGTAFRTVIKRTQLKGTAGHLIYTYASEFVEGFNAAQESGLEENPLFNTDARIE